MPVLNDIDNVNHYQTTRYRVSIKSVTHVLTAGFYRQMIESVHPNSIIGRN